MQRQQALVDTHREVSDNILQLTLYQTDLQRGRVSLGTGEVVDVQRALQMGWRPTTPEEEEGSDGPQYHEVDLTQEWGELEIPMGSSRNVVSKAMESSGIVPTMGNIRSEKGSLTCHLLDSVLLIITLPTLTLGSAVLSF
jgi:hypothetical protein